MQCLLREGLDDGNGGVFKDQPGSPTVHNSPGPILDIIPVILQDNSSLNGHPSLGLIMPSQKIQALMLY